MKEETKSICIEISQNGWEYTGICEVYADKVNIVSRTEAIAIKDGVEILLEFDEEIRKG